MKRTGNREAVVRRKGHRPILATFRSYEEAEGWATLEEARIIGGESRGGRAVEAGREQCYRSPVPSLFREERRRTN